MRKHLLRAMWKFRITAALAAVSIGVAAGAVVWVQEPAVAAIFPLPSGATLVFEADGIDGAAGSVVEVAGQNVATLSNDVSDFETVSLSVPGHLLRSGRVDAAFISGETGTDRLERRDDFAVQNVRMVLADGTTVVDERYAVDRPYLIGDGYSITEDPADATSDIPSFGYLPSRTEDLLRREFRFGVPVTGRSAEDAPEVPEVLPNPAALQVRVDDPDGDPVTIEVMAADEADIVSAAAGDAYAKPHERNPGATPLPLPSADTSAVAAQDGEGLRTHVAQGFPTHEFTLRVDPSAVAALPHVEVVWQGQTSPGSGATLYVLDLERNVWAEVASTPDADSDTVLSGAVDVATTVAPDGTIQLQVQEERFRKEESDVSFAWLTDTQFYSEEFPEIYDSMNRWIVDNAEAENIVYTIHTGDITQNYNRREWEWTRASASMEILEDGGMPYGIVTGNHDIGTSLEPGAHDHVYYDKYFPASRFEGSTAEHYTYGGHFGSNNQNHYDLVSYEGVDLLFLYLDWAAAGPEIEWANEVLQAHPNRHAVIATHQYINPNGAYTNDGRRYFDEVIVPNDNVFMVLSGHHIGAAYNVRRLPTADGEERVVMEIVHDYQGGPDGGSGYMRLMRLDVDELQLDQQPYSPYTDDFDYGAKENGWGGAFVTIPEARDDYTLSLDIGSIERELYTDRIAVVLRTGAVVASDSSDSGKTVVLKLPSELPPGLIVRLTDPSGGVSESRPYLTL